MFHVQYSALLFAESMVVHHRLRCFVRAGSASHTVWIPSCPVTGHVPVLDVGVSSLSAVASGSRLLMTIVAHDARE